MSKHSYSVNSNPILPGFAIVMYIMTVGPKLGVDIPWIKVVDAHKILKGKKK